MQLRMRQLVEQTGFTRSTIQYYLREGLLPEPVKLAANSALYDEGHVDRLSLIERAKRLLGDRPPLLQLKRVVELMDQGVEPDVAVALQRAVWAGAPPIGPADRDASFSLAALAIELGVDRSAVQALVDAALLVPGPTPDPPRFDSIDLQFARLYLEATQSIDIDLQLVKRIGPLLREVSAIEMEIRNRAVAGRSAQQRAHTSAQLQRLATAWRTYLAFRFRQRDIEREGLGPERVRHE